MRSRAHLWGSSTTATIRKRAEPEKERSIQYEDCSAESIREYHKAVQFHAILTSLISRRIHSIFYQLTDQLARNLARQSAYDSSDQPRALYTFSTTVQLSTRHSFDIGVYSFYLAHSFRSLFNLFTSLISFNSLRFSMEEKPITTANLFTSQSAHHTIQYHVQR